MARKLKTYQTSLGFYDQAIAAPSMKAALEAGGADSNLFHQNAAKQSDGPDVIAATMAKPGVVLKRAVGSRGRFSEHPDLPTELGRGGKPSGTAVKHRHESPRSGPAGLSIPRRSGRQHSPTNAKRSVASGNASRKSLPRGGSASASRRSSTRRRLRLRRPRASTPSGQPPSRPNARPSRRSRKPRTPAGTRKGRGYRANK